MDSAPAPPRHPGRIRAGETPEAVAQAAQTSVDKIMAFAAPVLAERQHVADRAQRSSVRRGEGAARPARRPHAGDASPPTCAPQRRPDTVEWGRLAPRGRPLVDDRGLRRTERSGTAQLTFDAPGNYVTPTTRTPAGWSARPSPPPPPRATTCARRASAGSPPSRRRSCRWARDAIEPSPTSRWRRSSTREPPTTPRSRRRSRRFAARRPTPRGGRPRPGHRPGR